MIGMVHFILRWCLQSNGPSLHKCLLVLFSLGFSLSALTEPASSQVTALDQETPTSFNMDKRGPLPQKPLWCTWKQKKNCCLELEASRLSEEMETSADPAFPPLELSPGWPCQIECSGGIYCNIAFLIWQPKMWGFEFAGKAFPPTNALPTALILDEKVFIPDFAWRPGGKLDLGYQFAPSGWDLQSRWTFYRGETTHLKKHFNSQINPPGVGIIPLWFYPFYGIASSDIIRFSEGKMSWRHYFNSFDLEIGRDSALSNRLSIRLFGGLKGAMMHQYNHIAYESGSNVIALIPGSGTPVPFSLLTSALALKNKTWGAGPRAGFESIWKLGLGFGFIADGAFSLLFSKTETRRDQNDLNLNLVNNMQTPFHMHLQTDSHQLKPVGEMKIGLNWESCVFERQTIGFSIGYEFQYWWAQNELKRNPSHVMPGGTLLMRGDLQMHGLTAEAFYAY